MVNAKQILTNRRVGTVNKKQSWAVAIAMTAVRFLFGSSEEPMTLVGGSLGWC